MGLREKIGAVTLVNYRLIRRFISREERELLSDSPSHA